MPTRPDTSVDPDQPPRSVGFLISQLGFASSKGFFEALRPLGIDPRLWTLLRHVAESEGQSQQAVAERLALPPSRMVALVDDLEQNGLLERRSAPDDRRVRALHLTPKGRRVLRRAMGVAAEHEAKLCAGLDEREREQLIDLLQKVQVEGVTRRGVHPGLAQDRPR